MAKIVMQVTFENGSSYTHEYEWCTEHEAALSLWHEARLTGKSIKAVERLGTRYTTMPGSRYPMIDCEVAQ